MNSSDPQIIDAAEPSGLHLGETAIPTERLEADLVAARHALLESDARFNTLADALPHMVWSTLPDGFHDYYNARWYEFTGVPAGSTDGEAWNGMFHPDDQDKAWARWRHSLETGEPYEIEYRLRHHSGEYRWTLGRAMPMRGSDGRIVRWIGTCTDIDESKRQAEQVEVLSRELSHRIKNIFAVLGGLVGMSARRRPENKTFAKELQERIAALGRAHEFVRPHSENSMPESSPGSLHGVFREILSPYPALEEGRVTISGDDVEVDDRGATPLALLIHELATNACKYGALCVPEGLLEITSTRDGDTIQLIWSERNGPVVAEEPKRAGFGSRLIELSIESQLGGTISRSWGREGLVATVEVPIKSLKR